MLLFDATHTSHTRAQTGIQRVVRSLHAALAQTQPVATVCHDPYLRSWRLLDPGEHARLRATAASPASRGIKWPWRTQFSGRIRRLLGSAPDLPPTAGSLFPELFSAKVGTALPGLLAGRRGPHVALFHDAIGLKLPEATPPGTVARLPVYLRELLLFDGIAAVSEDSAACLRDYWRWLGVATPPPIRALPLGIDSPAGPAVAPTPAAPGVPRVLSVGTIEGRKNHLALLDACEELWREGLRFELQLIGLARPDTAAPALARIAALRQAGRPLTYDGAVADHALQAAYARCTFTVYPSRQEGFGLPVLESLRQGKPCICSAHGALGESAQGGGCLALDSVDASALAATIRHLLQTPAELAALGLAAQARTFRTWETYAAELTEWMRSLPRRT